MTKNTQNKKNRHTKTLIKNSSQILYIATSQILDNKITTQIKHHRQNHPKH